MKNVNMINIENYEIAFSSDENENNSEYSDKNTILIIVEKEDIPEDFLNKDLNKNNDFIVNAKLVESPEFNFPKLFINTKKDNYNLCLNDFPIDIIETVKTFNKIWFCIIDGASIEEEFHLDLFYEDLFEE